MYILINLGTGMDEMSIDVDNESDAAYQALEALGYKVVERDEMDRANYEEDE